MEETTRYMYLTDCGHQMTRGGRNKSRGAIAVAYKISDSGVKFGVAFCSPKDRYIKSEGRARAEERLTTQPLVIEATGLTNRQLRDMTRVAIAQSSLLPRWAQSNPRIASWAVFGY